MFLSSIKMNQIILGSLLSTPAPTAPIVGIAFIVLFAIVGLMVGPDYDGMNAPAIGNSKKAIPTIGAVGAGVDSKLPKII
jgi:hypothetical protein